MKRVAILLALAAAAVAAILSISTRDAVAGVTFTEVHGLLPDGNAVEFVAGTEEWRGLPLSGTAMGDVPGTVLIARGYVLKLTVSGDAYIAGLHTNEFDWQLNLRTLRGAGFGTARIEPTAYSPGGWFDCRQTYVYEGTPTWSGPMVCHGGGTLDGVQLRLHLEHDSFTFRTTYDGYAFAPGS